MQMIGLSNWEGTIYQYTGSAYAYLNKTNWMCIEIESQLNRIGFKKRLAAHTMKIVE